MKASKKLFMSVLTAGVLSYSATSDVLIGGSVSPDYYEDTINAGDSVTITKTVTLPEITPKLDLLLLLDESGSYDDDFATIQSLAPTLVSSIRSYVPDSNFGLATFGDYYCDPFNLLQPLTSDENQWLTAVNSLAINPCAVDEPLILAIYLATGLGWDDNQDGDYNDPGDFEPYPIGWRPDATRVIVASTDEETQYYGGPTISDLQDALVNGGFKLIFLKAEDADDQLDPVIAATGGAALPISSDSSDIVDAILAGLGQLTFTVTANPVNCDPLVITFDPPEYTDVQSGTSVDFQETIEVPAGTASGVYECDVEFYADETLVGVQHVKITVPAPTPTSGYIDGGGVLNTFPPTRTFFRLYCDASENSLMSVWWRTNLFILTSVDSVSCTDDPAYDPSFGASFDTNCGTGSGTLNGQPATIEWCVSDNGFPGMNRDVVSITITDNNGDVVYDETTTVRYGNITARGSAPSGGRDTGPGPQ